MIEEYLNRMIDAIIEKEMKECIRAKLSKTGRENFTVSKKRLYIVITESG
jgi:hypothetical protein